MNNETQTPTEEAINVCAGFCVDAILPMGHAFLQRKLTAEKDAYISEQMAAAESLAKTSQTINGEPRFQEVEPEQEG